MRPVYTTSGCGDKAAGAGHDSPGWRGSHQHGASQGQAQQHQTATTDGQGKLMLHGEG